MRRSAVFDSRSAPRNSANPAVRWLLLACAVAGIFLYTGSGRLAALVLPDNPYADALWIGEISQVTRIRLDRGGETFRAPNLAKYPTDEALRAGAGRTNFPGNVYATGVVVKSTQGAAGCGCQ